MTKPAQTQKEKPPSAEVWFDLKYWKYTLPIIYIAYLTNVLINFSGFFTEVTNTNIENCVKIEGEQEFKYCEHFVLSDDSGVAYAACDPIKMDYNMIMGVNNLQKDQPIPEGGLWKVNYQQTPAVIEKFTIDNKDVLADFHPLGINLDIHPETGEKTLLVVNLPIQSTPRIEVFSVNDKELKLVHRRSIRHNKMYAPNSLHTVKDVRFRAADGTPSFFFSNDHYFSNTLLKKIENFVLLWSNVGFYHARLDTVEKGVNGLSFANGLAGTDEVLFIAETYKRDIKQYQVLTTLDAQGVPHVRLSHVNEARFEMAVDNLAYYPEKDLVVVAGHPKPLNFIRYLTTKDKSIKAPSQVVAWNVKTNVAELVVEDDGAFYRGATTAALDFENSAVIVSGILDEGILVCDA